MKSVPQWSDRQFVRVAPRMGAWIEIFVEYEHRHRKVKSLPAWGRGLKSNLYDIKIDSDIVAPRMGAWIEIFYCLINYTIYVVAPRMGAWIEIHCHYWCSHVVWSLPAWGRGLK